MSPWWDLPASARGNLQRFGRRCPAPAPTLPPLCRSVAVEYGPIYEEIPEETPPPPPKFRPAHPRHRSGWDGGWPPMSLSKLVGAAFQV